MSAHQSGRLVVLDTELVRVATFVATVGELVAQHEVSLFVVVEPLARVLGSVGHGEVADAGDDERDETFEDVDPAPAAVAPDTVRLANRVGEDTGEGSRQSGSHVEQSRTRVKLGWGVPCGDDENAGGIDSCLEETEHWGISGEESFRKHR